MGMLFDKEINSGATFSECNTYRYVLWRIWDDVLPKTIFIGLNPSIADAKVDDPTIRKCVGFAKRWGHGGIYMLNLFAYVSTDPTALRTAEDPVGPHADAFISKYSTPNRRVVMCHGAIPASLAYRQIEVLQVLGEDKAVWCFGKTNDGFPRHPSRLAYATLLEQL